MHVFKHYMSPYLCYLIVINKSVGYLEVKTCGKLKNIAQFVVNLNAKFNTIIEIIFEVFLPGEVKLFEKI